MHPGVELVAIDTWWRGVALGWFTWWHKRFLGLRVPHFLREISPLVIRCKEAPKCDKIRCIIVNYIQQHPPRPVYECTETSPLLIITNCENECTAPSKQATIAHCRCSKWYFSTTCSSHSRSLAFWFHFVVAQKPLVVICVVKSL